MTRTANLPGSLILALLLCVAACTPREQTSDETAPAPVDTSIDTSADTAIDTSVDTAGAPGVDTLMAPDTGVATPPITPPQPVAPEDTASPGEQPSSNQSAGQQAQFSQLEYEGWRQYSVNCARCHGQDVLPNPVAANLLISVAPGGPVASSDEFTQVVSEGRPERGMPAFKDILTPEQTRAVYAYVKGRAEKRLPAGRPNPPAG
jgi:mono/diheme cytochrome c family protein